MSHYKMIPMGAIPSVFYNHGYTEHEMLNIVFGMIEVWKMPGMPTSVTVEDVLSEMDLEPLTATMLIMQAGGLLTEVINHVRAYADSMELISWKVLPYAILLEIVDDPEMFQSHGGDSAADGHPANAGGLFELVHADRDHSLDALRASGLFYTSN